MNGNKMKNLVEHLMHEGIIKSQRVAQAMSKVDRGDFVDYDPYSDCP